MRRILRTRFDMLAELTRTEMVECLRKAVLALPEQYREVLILRDLEQMGHLETADLLQCSPGTVASRLHRARALLKYACRISDVQMNNTQDPLSEILQPLADAAPSESPAHIVANLRAAFRRHHLRRRQWRAAQFIGLAACC